MPLERVREVDECGRPSGEVADRPGPRAEHRGEPGEPGRRRPRALEGGCLAGVERAGECDDLALGRIAPYRHRRPRGEVGRRAQIEARSIDAVRPCDRIGSRRYGYGHRHAPRSAAPPRLEAFRGCSVDGARFHAPRGAARRARPPFEPSPDGRKASMPATSECGNRTPLGRNLDRASAVERRGGPGARRGSRGSGGAPDAPLSVGSGRQEPLRPDRNGRFLGPGHRHGAARGSPEPTRNAADGRGAAGDGSSAPGPERADARPGPAPARGLRLEGGARCASRAGRASTPARRPVEPSAHSADSPARSAPVSGARTGSAPGSGQGKARASAVRLTVPTVTIRA